jgi:hypothetical protein
VTKLVVDSSLFAQLSQVQAAELCDPSGRTFGHFLSEEAYRRLVYDWANAQVTDEELRRRLEEPGGRSLAEILGRLERQ